MRTDEREVCASIRNARLLDECLVCEFIGTVLMMCWAWHRPLLCCIFLGATCSTALSMGKGETMRGPGPQGAQERWGGSTNSTEVYMSLRVTREAAPAWRRGPWRAKRRWLQAAAPSSHFKRMVREEEWGTGRGRAMRQDEEGTGVLTGVTTTVRRLLLERR
jgi:hypothetical protein